MENETSSPPATQPNSGVGKSQSPPEGGKPQSKGGNPPQPEAAGQQLSVEEASVAGQPGAPDDPPINGFSPNASKLYYTQINKYLVDLERFSRLRAKQSAVDMVSSQNVKEAAAFLSSSRVTSRVSRYCETLGGLFLGGGISELLSLMQADKYSGLLVVITALLMAAGGILIGIFLSRD